MDDTEEDEVIEVDLDEEVHEVVADMQEEQAVEIEVDTQVEEVQDDLDETVVVVQKVVDDMGEMLLKHK